MLLQSDVAWESSVSLRKGWKHQIRCLSSAVRRALYGNTNYECVGDMLTKILILMGWRWMKSLKQSVCVQRSCACNGGRRRLSS